MKRLSAIGVAASCFLPIGHAIAADNAVSPALLTTGPWQFGLHGSARDMPVGLAFRQGFTAAVLTFKPNGKFKMEPPCQSEEFKKQSGGFTMMEGSWELKPENQLTMTMSFRGESKTLVHAVTRIENDIVLAPPDGTSPKRLGRFLANTQDECKDR